MKFLIEFFRNRINTGAIAPSSIDLAKLITDVADLENKSCVVELGSGSGVFTERILQKISSDCIFFSIEINAKFVKMTKARCPNAPVHHDSAENIKKYIIKYKRKKCDCIISGLPWAAFEKDLQKRLLDVIYDTLERGGVFLTFAYISGLVLPGGNNFKKLLRRKFKVVKKTRIVWLNLPPAFVYYCKK